MKSSVDAIYNIVLCVYVYTFKIKVHVKNKE